ncbi:MAG: transcription termination factor NusA [Lachnospiraceae bacterium]|jgi:N utilization substance protein A
MDTKFELIAAINEIEKEKGIDKEILIEALENSIVDACKAEIENAADKDAAGSKGSKSTFTGNIQAVIDRSTGEVNVFREKTVVEEVTDPQTEISLSEAQMRDPMKQPGDIVREKVVMKNFGRIAAQKAKQVLVQKIREEERKTVNEEYAELEKEVVTGIVQRYKDGDYNLNLGRIDTVLKASEQTPGEVFRPTERIKVYISRVDKTTRGPRLIVSRRNKELVRKLFEEEVAEIKDGTVEIRAISREPGIRSKIAVSSNNKDVDPVGSCVGVNGARVNAVVDELYGEKIDVIKWDDDPAKLIENALSPATVVSVDVDTEEKTARIVVPDYQLSLAIGKDGLNAKLAAKLTGYKIDIKSESQAYGD